MTLLPEIPRNLTQSYFVMQPGSFQEYILEEYKPDEPSIFCNIISYELILNIESDTQVALKESNCLT